MVQHNRSRGWLLRLLLSLGTAPALLAVFHLHSVFFATVFPPLLLLLLPNKCLKLGLGWRRIQVFWPLFTDFFDLVEGEGAQFGHRVQSSRISSQRSSFMLRSRLFGYRREGNPCRSPRS